MSPKQQSILLGAGVAALLSTSYLGLINCLCCLGVIIGGLAATWHYTDSNQLTIKPGDGAVMGLSAGALGALVALILNFVLIKMGIRHDLAMTNLMIDLMGDNLPREQYNELMAQSEAPVRFGSYFFGFNQLIGIVVSAVFGAVGGAIGAAIFKKGPAEDAIEPGFSDV